MTFVATGFTSTVNATPVTSKEAKIIAKNEAGKWGHDLGVIMTPTEENPYAKTYSSKKAHEMVRIGKVNHRFIHPASKVCLSCHSDSKRHKTPKETLIGLRNRVAGSTYKGTRGEDVSPELLAGTWRWTEANVRSMMCDPQGTIKRLSGNPDAETEMLSYTYKRHVKYGIHKDSWVFVCDKEIQDQVLKDIKFWD